MSATNKIEFREIMTIFRHLAETNKEVRLLNGYKGVPISYEAKIIEVADTSALLRTNKIQLISLDYEGKTHIQSLYLPKMVYARVMDVDIDRNESVVGDFEYVSGKVGGRTQVRVIPKRMITGIIQLEDSDKCFQGELADISLDGIGFFTASEVKLPEGFKKGCRLKINLNLPGKKAKMPPEKLNKDQNGLPVRHHTIRLEEEDLPCMEQVEWLSMDESRSITLSGELMNMHQEEQEKRWRIGMRIDMDDPHKKEIGHYITHRQAEIIREIKESYDKRSRRKR
jgi:hypothetical protein